MWSLLISHRPVGFREKGITDSGLQYGEFTTRIRDSYRKGIASLILHDANHVITPKYNTFTPACDSISITYVQSVILDSGEQWISPDDTGIATRIPRSKWRWTMSGVRGPPSDESFCNDDRKRRWHEYQNSTQNRWPNALHSWLYYTVRIKSGVIERLFSRLYLREKDAINWSASVKYAPVRWTSAFLRSVSRTWTRPSGHSTRCCQPFHERCLLLHWAIRMSSSGIDISQEFPCHKCESWASLSMGISKAKILSNGQCIRLPRNIFLNHEKGARRTSLMKWTNLYSLSLPLWIGSPSAIHQWDFISSVHMLFLLKRIMSLSLDIFTLSGSETLIPICHGMMRANDFRHADGWKNDKNCNSAWSRQKDRLKMSLCFFPKQWN